MTETLEHTARRIAEHGREALVARLRPAFAQAAAAHADVLELDDERLEAMVQRAADKADGVQWRRALATVASEELGIPLGEALGHPAVERAQSIVGAPSYEGALATAQRSPTNEVEMPEPREPAHEREEPVVAEEPELPAGEPGQPVTDLELPADEPESGEPEHLHLKAHHLHGVPDLADEHGELGLMLSADGLDVIREDGEIIGRLPWSEIVEFEVGERAGLRRRRRAPLVVRTSLGEATFEVSGSGSKLRARLEPLIERYLDGEVG